jgi:multicomponent Na+:H+ antiporter subunit C
VIDPFLLYSLAGAALFSIGLHGLVVRRHLLRKLLALNVMGSAVFLFLVALAYRNRPDTPDAVPDAVPHAMVLTGIVVAVSATAFALALARRIHALTGRLTMDDDGPDDGQAGDGGAGG